MAHFNKNAMPRQAFKANILFNSSGFGASVILLSPLLTHSSLNWYVNEVFQSQMRTCKWLLYKLVGIQAIEKHCTDGMYMYIYVKCVVHTPVELRSKKTKIPQNGDVNSIAIISEVDNIA